MSFFSELIEGLFFRTDAISYWSAHLYNLQSVKGTLDGEPLSENQTVDYEVLKPAEGKSRDGTFVFFFNSAQFNMSYSMQQVAFLAQSGYPVVMFDYRGAGHSQGPLSLKGMVDDAERVWAELKNFDFLDLNKVIVFGQGIGADAALRFCLKHEKNIQGVVLESLYATQQGWLKERYGPVIGDIGAALFKPTDIQPVDIISGLTMPLLLVCPLKDSFARKGQTEIVKANLPKNSEVWEEKGKNYLCVFSDNNTPRRAQLIEWIKAISTSKGCKAKKHEKH